MPGASWPKESKERQVIDAQLAGAMGEGTS